MLITVSFKLLVTRHILRYYKPRISRFAWSIACHRLHALHSIPLTPSVPSSTTNKGREGEREEGGREGGRESEGGREGERYKIEIKMGEPHVSAKAVGSK